MRHLNQGFLTLALLNILDQIVLCSGAVHLCTVRCLAPSLASTRWMPVAQPSAPHLPKEDQKYLRTLTAVSLEAESLWLKITDYNKMSAKKLQVSLTSRKASSGSERLSGLPGMLMSFPGFCVSGAESRQCTHRPPWGQLGGSPRVHQAFLGNTTRGPSGSRSRWAT